MPDGLETVEFATEYWQYLFYRRTTYGETLDAKTIRAQLWWLQGEPNPAETVRTVRENGNKSLRPLDDWAKMEYAKVKPKKRYAIRVHRYDRQQQSGSTIQDTVFQPRWKLGIGIEPEGNENES